MAKERTGSGDTPLRETEEVSINAIREWPVLLIDRKKELQALLASASSPVGASADAATGVENLVAPVQVASRPSET
jgi:hypothetical protein